VIQVADKLLDFGSGGLLGRVMAGLLKKKKKQKVTTIGDAAKAKRDRKKRLEDIERQLKDG
jgi:hypothetical protein